MLLNPILGDNNYRLGVNGRMAARDSRLQTPVTVTSKPSVPPMNCIKGTLTIYNCIKQ